MRSMSLISRNGRASSSASAVPGTTVMRLATATGRSDSTFAGNWRLRVAPDVGSGGQFEELLSSRDRKNLLGPVNIRVVDHHSLKLDRTAPLGFGFAKGGDELPSPFDFGIGGRENPVDRLHLVRVHRDFAIEAVRARQSGFALERRLIGQLHEGAVDQPCHFRRSCVAYEFAARIREGLARRSPLATDVAHEVALLSTRQSCAS